MFVRPYICSVYKRPAIFRPIKLPHNQYLHASCPLSLPRRKDFFSSNAFLSQKQSSPNDSAEPSLQELQKQRKRGGRVPAAPTSLRRVAVEAQRSKDGFLSKAQLKEQGLHQTKEVTAYAVAEQFNIRKVREILQDRGYEPDPFETDLYPQVVHVQVPLDSIRRVSNPTTSDLSPDEVGDIFVFPSGTVVAWSLPEGFTSFLATRTLLPAAEGAHIEHLETEDLEYVEDPQRENSSIKGDTIILGTKPSSAGFGIQHDPQPVDTVLTKVAFSSGLARSTKLAVLETLLANYFESTRTIPTLLSQGSRLPFTRDFILRKTGQLLSVRAQLNLYSELTDSLPDLFWDSRHDLGLEGYYEQVGRALDVGIRIKLLNEKMDYAQEIASVLRERLSETHGLRLEWIIILLIAVEVGFEVLRLWKERVQERETSDSTPFIDKMFQAIPGPQQVLKAITGSLTIGSLSGLDSDSSRSTYQHCAKSELSCQTRYHGQDTCCFNHPGGQFLQTQFWDADPAVGPEDSWTIHGLWPDYCNGGFDQFCDSSRKYSNISLIMVDSGRSDLLDEMRLYWKDFRGDDPNLWEHEWNKHGTCISTLETHCYDEYYPQQEVVDYFGKTMELFHKLPTHKTLENAGITPSYTDTYNLHEIQDALTKAHGAEVTVRCRGHSLNEIWYFFNVAGPLQTGKFVPSQPDGQTSNCPSKGLRYQPKIPRRHEPTKTRGPSEPTSPGDPFSGRGNLVVSTMGQRRGCIISRGTWFTSGTCATFKSKTTSGDAFTLHSSKGMCGFADDLFTCGSHITTPAEFKVEDSKLSYRGNTTFFADKAPKGFVQSEIFASAEEHPIELTIAWKESDH
ncbi:hypothetical protein FE257_005046 [Aspergillus nanangensis]|uniref:Ribonuclease T2-like n=1 Tax=Aspergillus nanangensis TaxID=2582783 RepID=A0AAD4CQZ7_ASPNN|nr:hypothetical protein FE257_005046 [Aspergillus nanangensis]